ncbi:phosphotransferase [Nocardia barduliensis]|uniref:phosphotransferase n=1 Tax=Nocardia barduliensis TaxID=2736643 RepID=UPI001573EE5B|nr:phosphotransferase [Nocardia barduliensis]
MSSFKEAQIDGIGGGHEPVEPSARYLFRRVVTVGSLYLADRVRGRQARSATAPPTGRTEVTRDWLTAALCAGTAGAEVEDFETWDVSSGTAHRFGIRVSYNDVGRHANLPTDVFAKTTHGFRQRLILGFSKVLNGEPTFYTTFRPRLDIEAPNGYHGVWDDSSWRSITLMEDISASKGATFLSPIEPLSRPHVEDLLSNLAAMHGRFWDSEDLHTHGLRDSLDVVSWPDRLVGLRSRSVVGEKRAIQVIPKALHGRASEIFDATLRSLSNDRALTPTLLHGDPHAGQIYRTADGRIGLADWQVVHRGRWVFDVAYTLNTALSVENRRDWGEELIAFYLDRLTEAGGEKLDFDAAWLEYRRHAFYPYIAWVFTIGRAAYQPKYQPDTHSLAIIERAANAIVDLGAFEALTTTTP